MSSFLYECDTETHVDKPKIGTASASVSQQVADVQRLMQKSGLSYSMHSAGTTVGKLLCIFFNLVLCISIRIYIYIYLSDEERGADSFITL